MQVGCTFVTWLKLGEFLLCSVEPISDKGLLPDIFEGDVDGVDLFMRSGGTF